MYFDLFDYLLLLQKGGKVCYFGQVDQVEPYFLETYAAENSEGTNITEFALEVIKKLIDEDQDPSKDFTDSKQHENVDAETEELLSADSQKLDFPRKQNCCKQFAVLIRRFFKGHFRNTSSFVSRMINSVVIGLLLGSLFFQLELDQDGAVLRTVLCFCLPLSLYFQASTELSVLESEREVMYRELFSKSYPKSLYFIAR